MTRILDAKYKKADQHNVVSESKHLTEHEQSQLLTLLRKYETCFDGSLGHWKTKPVNLELKLVPVRTTLDLFQYHIHVRKLRVKK